MVQPLEGINLYLWIPIILVSMLAIAVIFYRPFTRYLARIRASKRADNDELYEIIEAAGYL